MTEIEAIIRVRPGGERTLVHLPGEALLREAREALVERALEAAGWEPEPGAYRVTVGGPPADPAVAIEPIAGGDEALAVLEVEREAAEGVAVRAVHLSLADGQAGEVDQRIEAILTEGAARAARDMAVGERRTVELTFRPPG